MHVLGRVRLLFAVAVVAAVAACGGGGGGGGSTIPIGGVATPTPTPNPSGYVAPTGGVTLIPPAPGNKVSSSMLNASADGTFVVQSPDTPIEPPASSTTLTEYNVSASQSTAGQVPGSVLRAPAVASREDFTTRIPFRPALDPHSNSLRPAAFHGRSTLQVARGGIMVQSVRRPSSLQGDVRQFNVIQGVITGGTSSCNPPQVPVGTGCYLTVTATLQFVSNHAYVWVDKAIDSSYNMTATDWSATGTTFDADYARETAAFAPAFIPGTTSSYQQCDINGAALQPSQYAAVPDLSGTDPHISILITNALESTGEGGYFDFSSLLNDQELNCAVHPHIPSNALAMFVIGADKYKLSSGLQADEPYWRNFDMPRSLPHEFQHYLHALNKVLKADFSGGKGEFDDSFVDEGDSMLAEDLVNPGNAQSQDSLILSFDYLYNPANFSLTAFTGYDADPLSTNTQNPTFNFYRSTGGNYGAAYLFARYLYDRFGGDAALQRVYATLTPGPSSTANVNPIVAEANGETFAQVYGEFAAALAARNVASTDPRFTFSSTVFLRGKKTVTVPGSQIWDIQMNGPRSPDDLTSSTPLGSPRIKLTPGGSVTAKLITGATLYFNVAPAGGSVVSGTVTGAPSIDAALTQGAYDDTGACLGPPSSGC